jgi:hypothetical protein
VVEEVVVLEEVVVMIMRLDYFLDLVDLKLQILD